jgi:hypothetical protein
MLNLKSMITAPHGITKRVGRKRKLSLFLSRPSHRISDDADDDDTVTNSQPHADPENVFDVIPLATLRAIPKMTSLFSSSAQRQSMDLS